MEQDTEVRWKHDDPWESAGSQPLAFENGDGSGNGSDTVYDSDALIDEVLHEHTLSETFFDPSESNDPHRFRELLSVNRWKWAPDFNQRREAVDRHREAISFALMVFDNERLAKRVGQHVNKVDFKGRGGPRTEAVICTMITLVANVEGWEIRPQSGLMNHEEYSSNYSDLRNALDVDKKKVRSLRNDLKHHVKE